MKTVVLLLYGWRPVRRQAGAWLWRKQLRKGLTRTGPKAWAWKHLKCVR